VWPSLPFERQLVFDVNDFDETIAGPWEWDVARLTTSLMIAAEHRELDDGTCRAIAQSAVEAYRLAALSSASFTASAGTDT